MVRKPAVPLHVAPPVGLVRQHVVDLPGPAGQSDPAGQGALVVGEGVRAM